MPAPYVCSYAPAPYSKWICSRRYDDRMYCCHLARLILYSRMDTFRRSCRRWPNAVGLYLKLWCMHNGSNTCALFRFDLVFRHKTFTSSHRSTPKLTQDTQANRVVCSVDGAIVVGGRSFRYSDSYNIACCLCRILPSVAWSFVGT